MWRISLDREIRRISSCVADSLAFTPCYLVVIPTVGWGWEMVCVCVHMVQGNSGISFSCFVGISFSVLESNHRMCVSYADCVLLCIHKIGSSPRAFLWYGCILQFYWNTCMEQGSYWEANSLSDRQEVSRLLWNPKVSYHVHNSQYSYPGKGKVVPVL
jgi:hypothetical protein